MSEPRIISRPGAATRRAQCRRVMIVLAAVIAIGAFIPGQVSAQTTPPSGVTEATPAPAPVRHLLDGPRAQGLVGERFDGYAVPRGSVPSDVAALVQTVNEHRKATYEKRAAARNVPVDVIGKFYAAEIVRHAPVGTWFLGENGRWMRK